MASSALPDLQLGSDALMTFLNAELAQLEADQGCQDDEARELLHMLHQQTALMQEMSRQAVGGQSAFTELEIASQIDSLDVQLSQLEASLGTADASTMQLLGQSTSNWLLDHKLPADCPAKQSTRQKAADTAEATAGEAEAICIEVSGNSSRSDATMQTNANGTSAHAGAIDTCDLAAKPTAGNNDMVQESHQHSDNSRSEAGVTTASRH